MKPVDDKNRYLPMIRSIITFKFMKEEDVARIIGRSDLLCYQEGEKIITQGEINQDFFAVVEGEVQVSVTEENGKDVYICTIGSREVFGEAGMFLKVKRTANVESLSSSVILRIPRKEMIAFIRENPSEGNKILLVIIHSLLRKLREANQELAYERQMDADQCDIDAIVGEYMN